MGGYEVKFNIYAENQAEADAVSAAFKEFIDSQARTGVAVTARKVTEAVSRWGGNPMVRNRVINYFRNGR